MKKFKIHITIVIISVITLLGTLLVPKTTTLSVNQKDLTFGWPVAFVEQDQTTYNLPPSSVYSFSSPWENSTSILWGGVMLSFVSFILLFEILYLLKQKKK